MQDLRDQRTANCKQQGMQAEFPLWQSNTDELLKEFISLGFKSIVTCVDGSVLDESFVGVSLTNLSSMICLMVWMFAAKMASIIHLCLTDQFFVILSNLKSCNDTT